MSDKPDAIFFDWDGTLVDTLPGLLIAHNHVRVHFDLPLWTRDQFHKEMKYSSRELYPKIYGERTDEAIAVLVDFMDKHILNYLEPLKNSEVLLRRIHKMGIPIGIVSNKRHAFLIREIEHLGWGKYIAVQAGSGYADQDKPSGVPIRKALAEIGIKPEHSLVWFVGDTETDLLAAADAACVSVLILHESDQAALIEKHNPAFIFENCQDLLSSIDI